MPVGARVERLEQSSTSRSSSINDDEIDDNGHGERSSSTSDRMSRGSFFEPFHWKSKPNLRLTDCLSRRHVQYTSSFRTRESENHRGIETHNNGRLPFPINPRSSSVHVNRAESNTCKSSAMKSIDILQLSLTMSIFCMQIRAHIFAYVCAFVCVLETAQSREGRMALSRRKVRSLRSASAKRSTCRQMAESSRANGEGGTFCFFVNQLTFQRNSIESEKVRSRRMLR